MADNYLHSEITAVIIKAFYKVYNELGYGFLEKVYQNSLLIELRKLQLECQPLFPIDVFYENHKVGFYIADIIINNCVIIEIKAAECLCEEHEAQLTNYLRATDIEVGILLNFGKKPEFKRKVFSKSIKILINLHHYKNLRSILKIDIHTHIMPERMPNWTQKFGYGEFIHLEHRNCEACMMKGDKLFRVVEENCFKEDVRIKEMDETKVSMQVLSTIPVLFNYWAKPADGLETSRLFNDHIAETVNKESKRFIGLGTVPLQDIDLAIKEMERCVKELKMPGLEIGSNINGKNLSEKEFFPFYKAAEELGCALFVHPWEMMGEDQMQKYWLPWLVGMPAETTRAICSMIFGGVFETFPKLRVAFAHGGGSFPFTIGRIEHGFDVRPDLVAVDNNINPADYIGKFWVDSLVHSKKSMEYLIDVMGEDKICLGSDYPFPLGEHHPGKLIEKMKLSKKLEKKLLYKNAKEWLGLTH